MHNKYKPMDFGIDESVVKILGYGLTGLSFLLVLMAYSLMRKEQEQPQPRYLIVKTIWIYMALCLTMSIVVGTFTLFNTKLEAKNSIIQSQSNKLASNNTLDSVNIQIDETLNSENLLKEASELAALENTVLKQLDVSSVNMDLKSPESKTILMHQVAIKRDFGMLKNTALPTDSLRAALERIKARTQTIKQIPVASVE